MKCYLVILFQVLSLVGYGQILTPMVIGSSGSSRSNGSILLEDHMGSLTVSVITTQSFMYTEGFVQPDAGTMSGNNVYVNDVILDGGNFLLDAAGRSISSSAALLEYTMGEFACNTLFNSPNMLTQGLPQPKSCTPILTLTPANLPLMGSYQARDEIIISGLMQVNDHDVIFNAPVVTVVNVLDVKTNRQAVANGTGCVTQ
jgi:hypothetical protein